jgi:hypothetical protein
VARYSFGGDITHLVTSEDPTMNGALRPAPGSEISFFTTRTGGTAATDYLIDAAGDGTYGQAATVITVRETGYLPNFQGPDSVTVLWYDPDPNDEDVQRVRLEAWDVEIANISNATETTAGLARRATTAEVNAGSSDIPFVTPMKLAATTLFLRAKDSMVNLAGATDKAATWTVTDDGSTQSGWPDRLSFLWGAIKTGRFDRFGQLVAGAAKNSTVPLRVENLNSAPTANLIEAGITGSLASFAVRPNGVVVAPNIQGPSPLVLGATDPVPLETLDLTLIARLASGGTTDPGGGGGGTVLLIKDHPHEGTAGTAPTAAGEGYASRGGAAPVYVTGGVVGTTAIRWEGAVTGNLTDTFVAQDGDLYVRFYYRQDANGSGATSPLWSTSISLEVRVRTNEIVVQDTVDGGSGTATPKPDVGTWWRGLWRIGTTSSTLDIWTTPSSTGSPTYTTTTTYTTPKVRPTNLAVGQKTITGGQLSIDAVAVGTGPIGPAS